MVAALWIDTSPHAAVAVYSNARVRGVPRDYKIDLLRCLRSIHSPLALMPHSRLDLEDIE